MTSHSRAYTVQMTRVDIMVTLTVEANGALWHHNLRELSWDSYFRAVLQKFSWIVQSVLSCIGCLCFRIFELCTGAKSVVLACFVPLPSWVVQSIAMCVSVCLSARISPEPHIRSSPNFLCMLPGKGKGKVVYSSSRKLPTATGTHVPHWNHTVLPATRQRWHSCLYPSRSWYLI